MKYSVVGFTKSDHDYPDCDIYAIKDHLHEAVDFAKDSIRRGQFDAIEIHETEDDGEELCRVWSMGKTLTLEEIYYDMEVLQYDRKTI